MFFTGTRICKLQSHAHSGRKDKTSSLIIKRDLYLGGDIATPPSRVKKAKRDKLPWGSASTRARMGISRVLHRQRTIIRVFTSGKPLPWMITLYEQFTNNDVQNRLRSRPTWKQCCESHRITLWLRSAEYLFNNVSICLSICLSLLFVSYF